MEFSPISSGIEIVNIPILEDTKISKNGDFLPDNVRCIIVGNPGSGKTNLLLNLLIAENGLKFRNIYVLSRTLFQKKYRFLEEVVKSISGMKFVTYDTNAELEEAENIEPNRILIIDDLNNSSQEKLRKYFTISRQKNVDLFFIGHTYSLIEKRIIRDNANLICVFPVDLTNLTHIYNDNAHADMDFQKFRGMCQKICADTKYSFLVINREKTRADGEYCRNFCKKVIFSQ